jgi:hypothetical protein
MIFGTYIVHESGDDHKLKHEEVTVEGLSTEVDFMTMWLDDPFKTETVTLQRKTSNVQLNFVKLTRNLAVSPA